MVNYAIADSIPSGDVVYTIGEGSNEHAATISPSNTYMISTVSNLINVLANNDEIYVTGLSTGQFTTLINALINHQESLEISLYVKDCPDTSISFDGSNSKLSTLLFDSGAIESISISGSTSFLLIDNNNTTLTSVSFNGNKLDLSGCSNVELTTSTQAWVILKLIGCSNISLGTINLSSSVQAIDLTDINSVQSLICSNVSDKNIIQSALGARSIDILKCTECNIPEIDLSVTNTLDLSIIDSTCDGITLPQDMNSLVTNNLTNEISINSTKNLNVQRCNVSCETVNLISNNSSAVSINNSGTIGVVNANNLSDINISLEKCGTLNINNCTNVKCNTGFFTTAIDSLTIKNTTFNVLSIDFESNNIDISDISMVGQNGTLNIRNYSGTTEDLQINDSILFQSCSIWSCPNINLSDIRPDEIYLIDLPITELPSTWVNTSIYLYSCHNIESISGTYDLLFAANCSSLKAVDVSNIGSYQFIWNQSLDTIIKDGITYGNSGELIDNLITNPTDAYSKLLRFNAFRNLEIYSAPNIIDGKLVYDNQYNILVNNDTELENSINSGVKNENMLYTGLCTLGQDVTSDYSGGLGPRFIWIDFANINSSPFMEPADACGYNMNADVKNGLINIADKTNSVLPQTIITDISSSSFNNKYTLVLSTSELKPTPSDIPNKFSINLII